MPMHFHDSQITITEPQTMRTSLSFVTIQHLLYSKEMMFKGKDGSTSVFRSLTNGSARTDAENNVSGMGAGGSKSESMTMAVEAGAEDTSSDGY